MVHAHISIGLVDVFEAFGLEVDLKLLDSHRDSTLDALLRRQKDHIKMLSLWHKLLKLRLENALL